MKLKIDTDRDADGRWIAEVRALPGVVVYGDSQRAAIDRAKVLALRVLADRIEHAECLPVPVDNWFRSDEADADDSAIGLAELALAAKILEPEDFSHWKSYPGKKATS